MRKTFTNTYIHCIDKQQSSLFAYLNYIQCYIFAEKSEKTERTRISGAESNETGPQSPWGHSMPKEILLKIFEYVVASQGTLPSVIR